MPTTALIISTLPIATETTPFMVGTVSALIRVPSNLSTTASARHVQSRIKTLSSETSPRRARIKAILSPPLQLKLPFPQPQEELSSLAAGALNTAIVARMDHEELAEEELGKAIAMDGRVAVHGRLSREIGVRAGLSVGQASPATTTVQPQQTRP